jgi:hypothetical protein
VTKDPRWDGVELPSLWRVLVRVHGEEAASGQYTEAVKAVLSTGKYGEWHTVTNDHGQILGYRRLNPKEWFTFGKDSGEIGGPFPTKRLTLSALRAKKAAKVEGGIYETEEHYVFTRDRAETLQLNPEELP